MEHHDEFDVDQADLKQPGEDSPSKGGVAAADPNDDYEEIKVVAVDEPEDVLDHEHIPHYSE
jgi:hypothetical protein